MHIPGIESVMVYLILMSPRSSRNRKTLSAVDMFKDKRITSDCNFRDLPLKMNINHRKMIQVLSKILFLLFISMVSIGCSTIDQLRTTVTSII